MCDLCGASGENVVHIVVQREMVKHRPYVRDACGDCAKRLALRYYREGGEPIPLAAFGDSA